MLSESLVFICKQLNSYLRNVYQLTQDGAVLSPVIDQNGSVPLINQNRMVISLINIEKETTVKNNGQFVSGGSGNSFQEQNPPLYLNLDLLFSACFEQYEEALKFLSSTLLYFQSNSVFTAQKFPGLPQDISKLIFEFERQTIRDSHNLWMALGGKYMPSVVYKMRMLTIDGQQMKGDVSAITSTNQNSTPTNMS